MLVLQPAFPSKSKVLSAERVNVFQRVWRWCVWRYERTRETHRPRAHMALLASNNDEITAKPEDVSVETLSALFAIDSDEIDFGLSEEEETEKAEWVKWLLQSQATSQVDQASFPSVALQILDCVSRPEPEVGKLSKLLAQDPSMSASILSVANSALYRGVSDIETLRDAVMRLGVQEVGHLAIAVSARTLFNPKAQAERAPYAAVAERLYARSVAVAQASSQMALEFRQTQPDRVYLAGLLHDVGKALALKAVVKAKKDTRLLFQNERLLESVLDEVHVPFGVQAMRAWSLPHYISSICEQHHSPGDMMDDAHLHLVRLTSALEDLNAPLFRERAWDEVLSSARVLKMNPQVVRMLFARLKNARMKSQALSV